MKFMLATVGPLLISYSSIFDYTNLIRYGQESDYSFKDIPVYVSRECPENEVQGYIQELDTSLDIQLLTSTDYQNLVAVCEASAVEPLIEALSSMNHRIRANAALALGEIALESELVVPALACLLNDSNDQVRMSTIVALGQFGSTAKSAIPALSEHLTGDDKDLVATAAYAIGEIGAAVIADYEEEYTVIEEQNGIHRVVLAEEGETLIDTFSIDTYWLLFEALNQLYVNRFNDLESETDATLTAELSIVDAIIAINMVDILEADIQACPGGQLDCLAGGTELATAIQSQRRESQPAICRVPGLGRVVPRCRN